MTDIENAISLRRRRLPVVLGSEVAECGLCCIAMVARYHGHDVDLNGLRQRFPVSTSGVTLRGLIATADQLGLSGRALRAELDALGKVRLPAILHWDLNHFVVLKEIRGKQFVIHDPARGRRVLSYGEISNHFSGVVLELAPASDFRPIRARVPVRISSLWSQSRGISTGIGQVLLLSAALQVVSLAAPFQVQLVIDEAIAKGDLDLLNVLALGFGCLFVLQALIEAARNWSIQVFGMLFSYQVVGNLVRHLLRLPTDFFEKRHVGDILSRIGSVSAIQDILTKGAASAVIDGIMATIAVVILFIYAPILASVVLMATTLIVITQLALFPMIKALAEEQITSTATERSHIMESIRAATTVKIMGGEAEREGRWRNLFTETINASLQLGRAQIASSGLQSAINGISLVLVIYLGARAVLAADGMSIGMLMAFLSFRQTFADRSTALVNQVTQFGLLRLHLDRLGDIIVAEPDVRGDAPAAISVRGGIELRSVSFKYGASDRLILEDFDLKVEPGEFVAITGPSGAGKSTLLKLMLGLHPPTDGEIYLDGRRATLDGWRAWRQQIGVVAQDDRLMSGSVAENIAFFDPSMNMTLVTAAAQAAGIHDEIARMPMQYSSLIGDMGSSLSGGQRQRVLLARALYRKPRLLFLDEGTANLDEAGETAIAELISSLPITRVAIAHRPALIQRASRVIHISSDHTP